MFKNLIAYKFNSPFGLDVSQFIEKISENKFINCTALESESSGFITPFSEELAEQIKDNLFFKVLIETKILPAQAIRIAIEKEAKLKGLPIETKAQFKEVQESIMPRLLANALCKQEGVLCFIDTKENILYIDAGQ